MCARILVAALIALIAENTGVAHAQTFPSRPVLPDVPTMREAGYPELEVTNWSGIVVPGATAPSAIARLNAELARVLRSADMQGRLRPYGMSPAPGTPEQFDAFLRKEAARYATVVRESKLRAD